jgi:hypothetical protein
MISVVKASHLGQQVQRVIQQPDGISLQVVAELPVQRIFSAFCRRYLHPSLVMHWDLPQVICRRKLHKILSFLVSSKYFGLF